jgi:hypothetical protein
LSGIVEGRRRSARLQADTATQAASSARLNPCYALSSRIAEGFTAPDSPAPQAWRQGPPAWYQQGVRLHPYRARPQPANL